jgi:hypothetical protein
VLLSAEDGNAGLVVLNFLLTSQNCGRLDCTQFFRLFLAIAITHSSASPEKVLLLWKWLGVYRYECEPIAQSGKVGDG